MDTSSRKKFGDRFKVDLAARGVPWAAYNGKAQQLQAKSLIEGFNEDMDYEVYKGDLFYQSKDGTLKPYPRTKALVREETFDAPEKPVGLVSNNYNALQNADFARLFDVFSDSPYTKLAAYAAMAEGRDTVAIFSIKGGDFLVGSELNSRYLMIYNRHAGKMALKIGLVFLRAVCVNVMQHALESAESKINLYHTQHLHSNAELVVSTMNEANAFGDSLIDSYQKMMVTPITLDRSKWIFHKLAKFPASITPQTLDRQKAAQRTYDDLCHIYETESSYQGLYGTVYGVFNACTALANHMNGRNVKQQLMQPHSSRTELMQEAYKLCITSLNR